LVPLAWMVVPFVIVTAHLQARYGYEPVAPGRATIIKVGVKSSSAGDARSLSLEVPPNVRVESPMLWIPTKGEADWRVIADREGVYQLAVNLGGVRLSKALDVSSQVRQRSPIRLQSGILNQILYPAEPAIPSDSPFTSIAIAYEEASFNLLGWRAHWLVVFFVASFAVALALRRPMHVTF
jgi:hypothetical protein